MPDLTPPSAALLPPAPLELRDTEIILPDDDHIRAAIEVADERARLLRRLLRLSMRLRLHLTTADRLPAPKKPNGGIDRKPDRT